MKTLQEHKVSLPLIGSGGASHLELEQKPSKPFRSSMKKSVMFHSIDTSPRHGSQAFMSTNDISPRHMDSDTPKDGNKSKNVKIDSIVRRMTKKLNFLGKEKSHKFEGKMKIFEHLATFIDIKDYLQQMNLLNAENNNNNNKKNSSMLPPVKTVSDSKDYVLLSPNSTFDQRSGHKNKLNSSENASPDVYLDKPQAGYKKGFDKRRNMTFGDKVKFIRGNVAKFASVKGDGGTSPGSKKDALGALMEKAGVMLTQLTEAGMKLPPPEDTDADNFYRELQGDLVNNNYEKIDYGYVPLHQEEMDYYKNLLDLKDDKKELDEKYYVSYKDRADRIVRLLRKATKNIFNKGFEKKKTIHSKVMDGENSEREGNGSKKEIDEPEDQILEERRHQIELFLTSADALNNSQEEDITKNLEDQFYKMLQKVNNISQEEEKAARKRTNRSKVIWTEGAEEERSPENKKNHEINRAHKAYLKTVMDCLNNQEGKFKVAKDDFKKEIKKLGDAYSKDMQKFAPKTLESIKMTLDVDTKMFVDRPVRKIFSKKALNSL